MSWQPLDVELSARATEWGEEPTVLYSMLVNMDRPLWRQSVGARARFTGAAVRVCGKGRHCAWRTAAQMREALQRPEANTWPRCHGEQLMPNCRTMHCLGQQYPEILDVQSWAQLEEPEGRKATRPPVRSTCCVAGPRASAARTPSDEEREARYTVREGARSMQQRPRFGAGPLSWFQRSVAGREVQSCAAEQPPRPRTPWH
jgi:hypothetical protein